MVYWQGGSFYGLGLGSTSYLQVGCLCWLVLLPLLARHSQVQGLLLCFSLLLATESYP